MKKTNGNTHNSISLRHSDLSRTEHIPSGVARKAISLLYMGAYFAFLAV